MTTYATDLNTALRDFKRYTGDGLPNAPEGAALPIGDPGSGEHNPTKASLRTALVPLGEALDGIAGNVTTATNASQAAAGFEAGAQTSAAASAVSASNALAAALAAGVSGFFANTTAMETGTSDGDVGAIPESGGIRIYNNVSGTATATNNWLSRTVYEDVATFLASTETARGEGALWEVFCGGKLITYREAASGATGDIPNNAGGVPFYINQNNFELKSEAFGVKFGAVDTAQQVENAALLQSAMDYVYASGGRGRITHASEGLLQIRSAVMLMPGVICDGAGTETQNTLTRVDGDGTKFGQDSTYLTGGFAKTDHNDHPWYRCNAITAGADEVTLSNAADAVEFQADDIVWMVEADGQWGNGVGGSPLQSCVCRVISVAGGVLELEYHNTFATDIDAGAGTIAVDPTGAWIANVDHRKGTMLSASADWYTGKLFFLKDAELVRHRLRQAGQDGQTSSGGLFGPRSGVYNCRVEDIEGVGLVSNALFGNGYVRSDYHNIRSPYIRRGVELKYLSERSTFTDLDFWKMSHGFVSTFDEDSPFSVGENAKDLTIRQLTLDVGDWNDDGSGLNCLNIAGALGMLLQDFEVIGKAPFSSAIAVTENSSGAVFRNGKISVPTGVGIEDKAEDTVVDKVTFTAQSSEFNLRMSGPARGGIYTNNRFANDGGVKVLTPTGTAPDRRFTLERNHGLHVIDNGPNRPLYLAGNSSESWLALMDAGARTIQVDAQTSSTTAEVLGNAVRVPAGALRRGDVIKWHISGECSGSNGSRTLQFGVYQDLVGGATDPFLTQLDHVFIQGGAILPPTCMNWRLTISATMSTATRIATFLEFRDLTNDTTVGDVVRQLNVTYADNDIFFALSGLVANASDTIIARTIQPDIRRQGFV